MLVKGTWYYWTCNEIKKAGYNKNIDIFPIFVYAHNRL